MNLNHRFNIWYKLLTKSLFFRPLQFFQPWDESLLKARDAGTLVSLENLDPTYTSLEVEVLLFSSSPTFDVKNSFNASFFSSSQDLVWHALKEKVRARMIESGAYSNPLYGTHSCSVLFNDLHLFIRTIYESLSHLLWIWYRQGFGYLQVQSRSGHCIMWVKQEMLGSWRWKVFFFLCFFIASKDTLGCNRRQWICRSVFARRRNLVAQSKDARLYHGHLEIEERKLQRQSLDMVESTSDHIFLVFRVYIFSLGLTR